MVLFYKVDKHFGGLDYGLFYVLCYDSSKRLTLFHCRRVGGDGVRGGSEVNNGGLKTQTVDFQLKL